ncbi:MAG: squalene--hopene cyclase [Planctomycetota bacterium]|nr:squalene--hopene cyclase [Planctomycetota bacterium]
MTLDRPALDRTLRGVRERLLAERAAGGHWVGELSASALSTATATWALAMADREKVPEKVPGTFSALACRGLDWLAANQNEDGGWGDTVLSTSNISTTALAWAAFAACSEEGEKGAAPFSGRSEKGAVPFSLPQDAECPPGGEKGTVPFSQRREKGTAPFSASPFIATIAAAEAWLCRRAGSLEPGRLAAAIAQRYGKDRTFSAPILTMCALAGRLGPPARAWPLVPALPFELAACPHWLLGWLRLPVVSYALPALIAIGQVRHHCRPSWNPPVRALRGLLRRGTLEVLRGIQSASGGFLEAAPLTSFVAMSLLGAGCADHPVAAKALAFLAASARPDGSWPIDTNLATWVTTLSVSALAGRLGDALPAEARQQILDWLLAQQHLEEHPYTHAAPGGWAWTDLSGGVPDADDTAGALVALAHLGADLEPSSPTAGPMREAAARGTAWLLGLQNRDGGIPTFCRGWGALPFDRSSPDLTAHAIRAWLAWADRVPPDLALRINRAIGRALAYLARSQTADGAWIPLWFGNQWDAREENPLYGTSRVVPALAQLAAGGHEAAARLAARGVEWLLAAQDGAGAWGGSPAARPSIEETALAVEALAAVLETLAGGSPDSHAPCDQRKSRDCGTAGLSGRGECRPAYPRPGEPAVPHLPEVALPVVSMRSALARGTEWLIRQTGEGTQFPPAPIGFYFAKLWYYERLYPVLFTVSALERVRQIEGL